MDKSNNIEPITKLPTKKHGRPLLLEQYDVQVQEYARQLHLAGSVTDTAVVLAAAKGIVMANNHSLLSKFGGCLSLDKLWVKSLMLRMGYVKRRGSTSTKLSVNEYEKIKENFLRKVSSAVEEHNIPPELVVNVDETDLHLIPVSNWTMEKEGSQKVKIEGMDDKREVTAVVGASSTGMLLPIQILYTGETERCHPVGV